MVSNQFQLTSNVFGFEIKWGKKSSSYYPRLKEEEINVPKIKISKFT